jgi:hypothetical protein
MNEIEAHKRTDAKLQKAKELRKRRATPRAVTSWA